ncbi:beta-galactosidase [Desulfitobacterium sp.]|uniref:beta-galactosidase n=1 Tax=Desulfitobacterium sp. TaxID=49981 RepID=UPI002BD19D34|nr:beta-galactosidase [Desulfitobacterium sp.]HVJ48177.1 beta-galactosidase [Desulfitobacterium sp.]
MFKRRIILLLAASILAFGFLIWNWSGAPGMSLETGAGPISTQRLTLDLRGSWNSYSSLRQAFVTESQNLTQQKRDYPLIAAGEVILPSTQKFHVAVKKFQIPSEWSARNVLLQMKGVNGAGAIYLNGMDSTHQIGKFADDGGEEEFLLPANALHYGEDNLILIESSAPPFQENTLFGLNWPAKGQIKGALQLVATMETSLATPKVSVQWKNGDAVVLLQTQIIHHSVSEYGPWNIQGVLSDGSSAVATASAQIELGESSVQDLTLTFTVPQARQWTTKDPFRFQLYLTVMNPKGDKDDVSIPLGLSSITLQEGKFVKNGQPLTISGLTLSPEQEAQVRHTGQVQQWLTTQKDKGYNLIYFIGPFPDEAWLEAADQMGMGIWAELPAKMVPANRLPNPSGWGNLIRTGMLHPSLWAWTGGTGLEADPRLINSNFWNNVQAQTQPLPTFIARVTGAQVPSSLNNVQLTQSGFQGPWGKVVYNTEGQTKIPIPWSRESLVAGIWAAWVLLVILANISASSWRYKDLKERKPKRALRRAWYWQGLALLSREGTLAGIVTSFLFHTQVSWAVWIPEQWPLWAAIQQQSPLLIWIILTLSFVLLRLLHIGVAAPHMPEAPAALGLALWLERRYRWIWIPALLWAAHPWGVPIYLPLAVYGGLSLLFLPIRIRDVHKVKGHYRPILFVPGILSLIFLVWATWRWTDWYYLWYLVVALRG